MNSLVLELSVLQQERLRRCAPCIYKMAKMQEGIYKVEFSTEDGMPVPFPKSRHVCVLKELAQMASGSPGAQAAVRVIQWKRHELHQPPPVSSGLVARPFMGRPSSGWQVSASTISGLQRPMPEREG